MKRLFFALWPSDKIRKQIDSFNCSISSAHLKKVKTVNLHVTLVFLGIIDLESELMLRQSMSDINVEPFVLHFDQLAFWSKPQILCLLTQHYDEQLIMLFNGVKRKVEQCGIKTEERLYKPHITVARKACKLIDAKAFSIEWPVRSFCLIESCSTADGVSYQVLQRWRFKCSSSDFDRPCK